MISSTLNRDAFRVLNMGKTTLWERLLIVKSELGIEKDADFAGFCGVSASAVSQWKSGAPKLGVDAMQALARTRFSLDWIIDGKLPMYSEQRKHIVVETAAVPEQPLPDEISDLIAVYFYSDETGRRGINTAKEAAKADLPSAIRNKLKKGS
jgi:transcriptional regulator with XRE-family HTH domain